MFSARILFHAHRNAWRARCAVCTQLTHNGDNNEKLPLSPVRAEKTFHLSHRIHNGHNWVKCVTNWQSSESIYVHTVHCFHSLTVCAVLWLLLFLFRIHHSADDGCQRPIAHICTMCGLQLELDHTQASSVFIVLVRNAYTRLYLSPVCMSHNE